MNSFSLILQYATNQFLKIRLKKFFFFSLYFVFKWKIKEEEKFQTAKRGKEIYERTSERENIKKKKETIEKLKKCNYNK
jgi:hypothetical protein